MLFKSLRTFKQKSLPQRTVNRSDIESRGDRFYFFPQNEHNKFNKYRSEWNQTDCGREVFKLLQEERNL